MLLTAPWGVLNAHLGFSQLLYEVAASQAFLPHFHAQELRDARGAQRFHVLIQTPTLRILKVEL